MLQATSDTTPTSTLPPILRLPHEIRLQILLLSVTTGPLTITTTTNLSPYISSPPILGIPESHVPILKSDFAREALLTDLRGTQYGSSWPCSAQDISDTQFAYPHTFETLSRVCRTFRDDLAAPPWTTLGDGLELHLSYPGGVCAALQGWPWLVSGARKVSVYGVFNLGKRQHMNKSNAELENVDRAATKPRWLRRMDQELSIRTQVSTLKRLTSIVCGEIYYKRRKTIPSLRAQPAPEYLLRVWYPYNDNNASEGYTALWNESHVPSMSSLQQIPAGRIGFYIYRGNISAGVEVTATPGQFEVPRERCVHSRFPMMPGDRRCSDGEREEWAVDGGERAKDARVW